MRVVRILVLVILDSIVCAFQPPHVFGSSGRGLSARSQSKSVLNLKGSAFPIYDAIERKLTDSLKPTKLKIVDNSHQHAGN